MTNVWHPELISMILFMILSIIPSTALSSALLSALSFTLLSALLSESVNKARHNREHRPYSWCTECCTPGAQRIPYKLLCDKLQDSAIKESRTLCGLNQGTLCGFFYCEMWQNHCACCTLSNYDSETTIVTARGPSSVVVQWASNQRTLVRFPVRAGSKLDACFILCHKCTSPHWHTFSFLL